MSGAFHRFRGLTNTHSKEERKRTVECDVSEPCLYVGHRGNKHGWRRTSDGACVECLDDQVRTQSLSFDISQLHKQHRTRALRFWSKVEITHLDDCWKYEGSSNKKKLVYLWKRSRLKNTYSHHSIRIATWLCWGDIGNSAITSLCGERRCCNPLHNIPDHVDAQVVRHLDKERLEEQLDVLKGEVIHYLQTKAEQVLQRQLKGDSEANDSAFIPLITSSHEGFDDYEAAVLPYHLAIEDTLQQLNNGSHSSLINLPVRQR